MKITSATGEIKLEAWCPYCKILVQVLDQCDGTPAGWTGPEDYTVECESCGEQFKVNQIND